MLGEAGSEMQQEIHLGQIVSDVAQAVGRIRRRKVVDADGNCAHSSAAERLEKLFAYGGCPLRTTRAWKKLPR
jgi:hypothetical protein